MLKFPPKPLRLHPNCRLLRRKCKHQGSHGKFVSVSSQPLYNHPHTGLYCSVRFRWSLQSSFLQLHSVPIARCRFWSPTLHCCALVGAEISRSKGSSMPKQKTHKGMKRRFRVTASGKAKHRSAYRGHLLSHKNAKRKRGLRQDGVVDGAEARKIVDALRPSL